MEKGIGKFLVVPPIVVGIIMTGNRSSLGLAIIYFAVKPFIYRYSAKLVGAIGMIVVILGAGSFYLYSKYLTLAFNRIITMIDSFGSGNLDVSASSRFSNNYFHLKEFIDSDYAVFLFGGQSVAKAADSDLITILLHYGLLFTTILYGFLIMQSVLLLKKFIVTGNRFYVTAGLTGVLVIIESVLTGGAFSVAVSLFFFFLFGNALAESQNNGDGNR